MPFIVEFDKLSKLKKGLKMSPPQSYLDIKDFLTTEQSPNKTPIIDISEVPNNNKFGVVSRIVQGWISIDELKTKKTNNKIIFLDHTKNKALQQKINILIDLILLINKPSNIITPITFSDYTVQYFQGLSNVHIDIYNNEMLKELGLNLISVMGRGSKEEPRFISIEINKSRHRPICLIGKGVTFDTGGIHIKDESYDMHLDKSGACIVLALAKYMALYTDTHCVVMIPLIENNINNAIKPGDVISSYDGKTVEIVNTDAEGRVILADALAFMCDKYQPALLIDIATLTRWSDAISCDSSYVFFTLNDKVAQEISRHSDNVFEKSVRFPLWTEYITYTKSSIADVKNFGFKCKKTDGMMAALFMMNFIPNEYHDKWVHFDVKIKSVNENYGTGDSFLTLLDYLSNHHP